VSREPLRERWAGGTVALVGILCAASTTVWPTKIVALHTPEVGDFTKGFEHRIWSWGREAVYSSDGVPFDAYSGPVPTLALVFLVLVLALAAAGVVAWLGWPGRRGEVLGVAGTALAAAAVGQSVVSRVSFDDTTIGLQPGLAVVTPVAGRLEYAAAVLLVSGLVLMLEPRLPRKARSAARSAVVSVSARAARARIADDPPRRNVGVIHDVTTSPQRGPRAGDGAEVGFSDGPSDRGAG